MLCGGCQAPGKASQTGLFIGDLLPALKYTKFGFEILQHCGNNVIPALHTSVVCSAVIHAQVPALPGSVPVLCSLVSVHWCSLRSEMQGFAGMEA